MLYFHNFIFQVKGVEAQNIRTLRRFKKDITCEINHIDSEDIRQRVVKNKKMFDAF